MIARRPLPRWRRHPPRVLALIQLLDGVVDEAALWPASSPARRALNRAERAVRTAIATAQEPPE